MTSTADLVTRGLGAIPPTAEHLQLIGTAVYSWWRPFPAMVYLPAAPDGTTTGYVELFARALTELAGRSRERGDNVLGYQRGEGYAGPEPFLFTGTHPSEPVTSDHGRYFRKIVDAMAASQSPSLVPDVTERIRLAVVTGDAPLPGKVANSFLEVNLSTEVPFHRWEAMERGRAARLELAAALEQWIDDHRKLDSDFFSSWEQDEHPPAIAARIGQEILNAFLIDEGLPSPLEGGTWTTSARADSASRAHRRTHPSDPGIVTMTRDLMRDAIATRRARMGRGDPDMVDLGRLVDGRLYVIPHAARDLVLSSGHTTAGVGVFSRSLGAEGWIKRAADGAWTEVRRIDGKLTRVWDMPTEFLGSVVEYIAEEERADPAKELAEIVRSTVRAAIAEGRAALEPASEGVRDIGRKMSGRLYLVPSTTRGLLAEDGMHETPITISRSLEAAGWLTRADGAMTVPRRIDGKMMRVWNLPLSFLDSGVTPQ